MCGVPANSGGYCSKQNDSLINSTLTTSNMQAMYTWQNYVQPQLPDAVPAERCLRADRDQGQPEGCHPAAGYSGINPENWYFVK